MPIKKVLFPKTYEEKLLSKQYFNKKEKTPEPAPTPKLSEEEIQHYIDLMLEASKPTEYVDRTKQILLERFPQQNLAGN
ncbi:hypothetical protein LOY38_01170 [Pseudomonas sp. B21-015]|uniref:hypothetical protein n=1 Tax=Pseudomonas sp. B21-015 TaxID=2895473 RepID=UPI00215F9B60|nr:hypothetical protein [Pseudomonas sp. B21-015]UVM50713.1 hypothetical protein LOY38_01170 [Pseudomonas sp. B21-015]